MFEGVNSQLSDIDFYDQLRLAVKKTGSLTYDVTLPNYFKKNPYLSGVLNSLNFMSDAYFSVL